MIKSILKMLVVGVGVLCGTACGHKPKTTDDSITVYSGAGLTDALTELRDSFEVNSGCKVNLNLASSGTLARQIENGGEPDIYISASVRWANYIDSLGYMLDGSRVVVVVNDLALIAPSNSPIKQLVLDSTLSVLEVLDGAYFAIGNPAHVPAGKYAKQTLDYFDKYNTLHDHLLLGKDVRSVLMMVEMEEAALGLVYTTDALRSKKVKFLGHVPSQSHTPIEYVGGLCSENVKAKLFLEYITHEKSREVWEKYGFKK